MSWSIHSLWAHQRPRAASWWSLGWSEYLWWWRCSPTHSIGPLWQARAPISTSTRSTQRGATKLRWDTSRCSPRVTPITVTQYSKPRATTACQLQNWGSRAKTAATCMASMKPVVPRLILRCLLPRGSRGTTRAARMRASWAAVRPAVSLSWRPGPGVRRAAAASAAITKTISKGVRRLQVRCGPKELGLRTTGLGCRR